MSSVRTMMRGENAGMTCTVGGSLRLDGGSSGTPTERAFQARARDSSLHGAEELRAQPGHPQHARTGVGADDRPDLRQQLGIAPVDLAPALGQALGFGGR